MRQLWPRAGSTLSGTRSAADLISHLFHQPFGFPSEQCRESRISLGDEISSLLEVGKNGILGEAMAHHRIPESA